MLIAEDEIEGVVEDVVFSNDESGYYVFSVDAGELITVVGNAPGIYAGEGIHAYGKWVTHPTYGKQFVCEDIEKSFPVEQTGILKFLASGAIRGVGKVTAEKLVAEFGTDTLQVIENEPLKMTVIRGITTDRALEISEQFRLTVGMRDILMYLTEYNISPSLAVKVYKEYGGLAVRVLEGDPYRLWDDIDGFSFDKADEIATKLCFDPLGDERVFAHIRYVLRHNLQNGHTFLPQETLCRLAMQLLDTDEDTILIAIENMCERKILTMRQIRDVQAVYLTPYFNSENYIAGRLSLMTQNKSVTVKDIEKQIDRVEKDLGIRYAGLQRQAIAGAIEQNLMILTGGPGTGKTTTLRGMIHLLEQLNYKFMLCAPTGRAANRISELCGHSAQTIHRLLEVDAAHRDIFGKNEQNPIATDALVVDEMSMVDVKLFEALLRALRPGTKLILVGDADQLPSVGPGNVFRDLLRSEKIFTVALTEIFRQAASSRIVVNAHKINHGEYPSLNNTDDFFFVAKKTPEGIADAVVKLICERIPKVYGCDVFHGVQVISPTKKTAAGTVSLNEMIRARLGIAACGGVSCTQGGRQFCVGDKVMQTRNNYDIVYQKADGSEEAGIFNGDIGVVERIVPKDKMLYIRFEDRLAEYPYENLEELDYAYAVTAHKSQGSEFEIVVISLPDAVPLLQYRNLLYTAVTRAKRILLIVGSETVVWRMVDNNKQTNRFSGLRYLLEAQR